MARYEDDDEVPPRRRRENMMDRRLRRARGEEEPDDDDYSYDNSEAYEDDDYDNSYAPRMQGYARQPAPVVQANGCAQAVLYLTLGGVAVLLIVAFFLARTTSNIGSLFSGVVPSIQALANTPTTTLRLNAAAVVRQIQQVNKLETTSFTIEKVIEAGVEGNPLYNLLYKDQLLLIAHGTVVAGIDLSKLQEDNVTISPDGQTLTLRLPPAEILSASLDNNKTRVYQRDQGVLAGNKDLETQARQAAEQEILKAACEDGILQKASNDGSQSIQQLFKLAEFKRVVVVNASTGPCVAPAQEGAKTTTPVP